MSSSDEEKLGDDQDIADEQPEMVPSRQQKADAEPDAYTVGYDEFGKTRVGIGTAGGNIARLVRHNEGRHQSDGNLSIREAARDKKRITQAFCSSLDLTPYQQQEAVSIMGRLNLDRFGRQKRIEKVALGVIKVVVNRDRFRPRGPRGMNNLADADLSHIHRISQNEQFVALRKQFGVSKKDLYSISQLVKRELKRIGYYHTAEGTKE